MGSQFSAVPLPLLIPPPLSPENCTIPPEFFDPNPQVMIMTGPFVYEITHFGLVTILISETFCL